jgi:hypothetical protein
LVLEEPQASEVPEEPPGVPEGLRRADEVRLEREKRGEGPEGF